MTDPEGAVRLWGDPAPRVSTATPAGPERGSEAVAWAADVLGVELLPWQRLVLERSLVVAGERWASRTVGIVVARQNGKTRLMTVRALAGMVLFGELRVLAAAQSRNIAKEAWRDALELAEAAGLPVRDVRRQNGEECFWIGPARYMVAASNRNAARGQSADLVMMDEVQSHRDWEGYSALEKTRSARPSSQMWAIGTEGDDGSVVLDHLAAQGRLAADTGTGGDLAWLEWSAEPGVERTDPRGWAQANPALGHLITADTIRSELRTDPAAIFETERLCRRVASLRPWITVEAWDETADPAASVPDGVDVVFALDAGPELRHATVAVGWRRPDGRVFVEAVGGWDAATGPVLPRATEELAGLLERWATATVVVLSRSGAESAADRVTEATGTPVLRLTGADLVRAVNGFHEAVVARQIVHPADPMTTAHIAAVTSEGVLRRRSALADIDAAVAVVLARYGILNLPASAPTQDWFAY
jgi:hypothetical protein